MDLDEALSSFKLRKEQVKELKKTSSCESLASVDSGRLSIVREVVNKVLSRKKPPYLHVPNIEIKKRTYSDKHFTLFVEHLSSRYIKAMELCHRLDRRVFNILWTLFPEHLFCFQCNFKADRSEHKKLFWDFHRAVICCSRCIDIEDLRSGIVTSLISLLSPGFHGCVVKNLERDDKTYDEFLPRFGVLYSADSCSAINGLRKYTTDLYLESHLQLRNDLYETYLSKFVGNDRSEDIEKIRSRILTITACFKVVDVSLAFALKSTPCYIPKMVCNCKCGHN